MRCTLLWERIQRKMEAAHGYVGSNLNVSIAVAPFVAAGAQAA